MRRGIRVESTDENLRFEDGSRRTSDPRSCRRTQKRPSGRNGAVSSRADQESADGSVRRPSGSGRTSSTHRCGKCRHASSGASGCTTRRASTPATQSVQYRGRGVSCRNDLQSRIGSVRHQGGSPGTSPHRHGISSRETWPSRQSFVCTNGYLRSREETLRLALEKSTSRRILYASPEQVQQRPRGQTSEPRCGSRCRAITWERGGS